MMPNFYPPARQSGLIVHGLLILILMAVFGWGIWNLAQAAVGPAFIVYLLVTLAAFIPIPFLGYRAFALLKANYSLDRDNLSLRWGLRLEELPLSDIEWVRPVTDLSTPLALPWFRLPGSILGLRRHPDLGLIEFLASERGNLLLVATAKHIFAISPADPASFVHEFQRSIELGSLTPAPAKSVYPTFVVARAWDDPLARFLWAATLFLNIGLFVWVGLMIPGLSQVNIGFGPSGLPLGPFPAVQIMLLPILSVLLSVTGWLAGLYYYRYDDQRILAFILWSTSILSSLLFLLAVLFAFNTPV
jgi:hypothetical protein